MRIEDETHKRVKALQKKLKKKFNASFTQSEVVDYAISKLRKEDLWKS